MNKDAKFIFLVVLSCFVLVNVCIQIQMSQGYNPRTTIAGQSAVGDVVDYDIGTKLIPLGVTFLLLSIVFISLSDPDDSLVAQIDKRLFGEK